MIIELHEMKRGPIEVATGPLNSHEWAAGGLELKVNNPSHNEANGSDLFLSGTVGTPFGLHFENVWNTWQQRIRLQFPDFPCPFRFQAFGRDVVVLGQVDLNNSDSRVLFLVQKPCSPVISMPKCSRRWRDSKAVRRCKWSIGVQRWQRLAGWRNSVGRRVIGTLAIRIS